MSQKTKQELEKDVKDLIKVNHKNVIHFQVVDKENIHLNKLLKEKDEEIFILKQNVEKCSCSKYNKSMDEVIKHGQKHKDAVIELKRIAELQKEKVSFLKEEKISLLDQVDNLEFEVETDKVIIGRHKDKVENLESELKILQKSYDEKTEESNETNVEREKLLKQRELLKEKYAINLKDHQAFEEKAKEEIDIIQKQFDIMKCKNLDLKNQLHKKDNETAQEVVKLKSDTKILSKIKDLEDELSSRNEEIMELHSVILKTNLDKDLKTSSA